MTGRELLKKLSILCYVLGILGVILGVIAMNTNLGETLFQDQLKNISIQGNSAVDVKILAGIIFITESVVTLFEGWLLGRAIKDGRKTTFLIVLLALSIITTIIELCQAGFNSILNMESVTNIIVIIVKGFVLNQVLKVRNED